MHPKGVSAFRSVEEGRAFRDRAYEQYGIVKPQPWALGGAPRTITLLSAVGGEEVSRSLNPTPALAAAITLLSAVSVVEVSRSQKPDPADACACPLSKVHALDAYVF